MPALHYILAAITPIFPVGFFLIAQTSYAHAMCAQIGFAQPPLTPSNSIRHHQGENNDFTSLFYLLANKELVIAVILASLMYVGEWKAAGIALGCTCVLGLMDMYVSVVKGSFSLWQAFWAIGFVKGLGGWAAWRVCVENW